MRTTNDRQRIGGTARIAASVAIVSMLAACTTINPYTGESQTSKATKGTAIGAATGAIIGAVSGGNSRERRERALIGAGAGALAGGSVGFYMDQQEAKLRERLRGTGVSVTRNGNNIVLNMPGNITFQTDSADLRPQFFAVLDSVGLVINEFNKTLVEISGHTDSTGSNEYNQALSERRANTVAHYILGREVDRMRVLALGYGETRPIASNDTADGRQSNRRVEIELVPLTQG
jgi:outer membrane protein OmpA-like peptidoglycan-associated protein